MKATLYITRNGLLEPLGQSQVMAYLRGLSAAHRITLITFEKSEDAADAVAMEAARRECAAHGIQWRPQRFHRRPRIVAPAWSMLVFLRLCLRAVWRGEAELIHARSYIPAAVAWLVWRLTGTPFIFDMRALWPEELVTAGRLRRGSWLHRRLVAAERICLRDAAAVVSLTDAGAAYLHNRYPRELRGKQIHVIPTCADLERFTPEGSGIASEERVYGCIGTVLSGWFRLDWLAALFRRAAERDPGARFEIITRDNEPTVRGAMAGVPSERLIVRACAPSEMPSAIGGHTVSVMLYAGGAASELGRAPTRLAEVLGCAVPVIASLGVGDVASVVRQNRVGVLLEGCAESKIDAALAAVEALLEDAELPARCRRTAEALFSLDSGTRAYGQIYRRTLEREHEA